MNDIRRLEREIAKLKRGIDLKRVLRTSIFLALFSVYGYLLLTKALPPLIRGILRAW